MSNRIRILSSDHDNSKYFIDEKLKHALEVNQSITCFNGSFDLFFGYKVDSVDVDLINHNVTVVLHEDEYLNLTTCPKCGCSKLYLHGTTKINVADIPFLGMPTKLEITRKRYRCSECGSTHVIEPEMKIDGYKMTRRLHSYIASKFTNVDVSVASIAKDTGVYWNAVKDIEKSSLEKKFEYINTQGVQFIAMDEISVGIARHVGPFTAVAEPPTELIAAMLRHDAALAGLPAAALVDVPAPNVLIRLPCLIGHLQVMHLTTLRHTNADIALRTLRVDAHLSRLRDPRIAVMAQHHTDVQPMQLWTGKYVCY